MKNLTIILFLVFTSIAQCQTVNIITQTEFDNIKINGHKLIDLKNTLGKQNAIEALFGIANIIEKDDDPIYGGSTLYIEFYYNGLEFSFSKKELGSFLITNNNSNITIQGKTVTIGDNISALGTVYFRKQTNGNRAILYKTCEACNSFIAIDFNQTTNVITKIIFIEMT